MNNQLYKEAIDALLTGAGYYLFPSIFSADQVKQANDIIIAHSQAVETVTHFHGEHADKIHLQKRVWNLLNKGDVFVDMVQHEAIMAVFSRVLGRQFILGSFAANRLLPGAPGQEPHIDYPYWDMHDIDEFPAGMNAGFHMNCQSLITLHDFTAENGGTGLVPHSQKKGVYPSKEQFVNDYIQIEAPAGSLLLFTGFIWHASMPNNSESDRSSVLGQYLPKFVKPMEDLDYSVDRAVIDAASPAMRQLLGLDLRYPERIEKSSSGNAEGRNV